MEDLIDTIYERLIVKMLQRDFFPIDDDGNLLYFFKPYGFKNYYGIQAPGYKKALEEIAEKVKSEFPGLCDIEINLIVSKKEGELYKCGFAFNDYNMEEVRNRLMLAVFFRFTLLARKRGFLVTVPSKKCGMCLGHLINNINYKHLRKKLSILFPTL